MKFHHLGGTHSSVAAPPDQKESVKVVCLVVVAPGADLGHARRTIFLN